MVTAKIRLVKTDSAGCIGVGKSTGKLINPRIGITLACMAAVAKVADNVGISSISLDLETEGIVCISIKAITNGQTEIKR